MYASMTNPSESWYFDRSSVDTTIDGFEWTPWFKLSPSVQNLCIEWPVETQFDPSGPSLPDATNDQGLGGHAYLDPCYVEYDWELRMNTSFFILNPFVTYTMTNTDGSLFHSGSFDVTEDTNTLMTLETLMNSYIITVECGLPKGTEYRIVAPRSDCMDFWQSRRYSNVVCKGLRS